LLMNDADLVLGQPSDDSVDLIPLVPGQSHYPGAVTDEQQQEWGGLPEDPTLEHILELLDGRLTIDPYGNIVRFDGEPVEMTPMCEGIFSCLVAHLNRVVTRAELLKQVWGPGMHAYRGKTLDVHISMLRKSLGPDLASHIVTVRGVGYRFDEQLPTETSTASVED
jgi:DNA-binding response OmpR family regulator